MDARKLAIATPTDREIVMTRIFEAPRTKVFDALTKPELLKRWLLGPPGWTMEVCDIDLKVGGNYRYVWKNDSTGKSMGMGGVYREIDAPKRIVSTEVFDDSWYPGEAVGTVLLTEQDGVTTLVNSILYQSQEARDAVIRSKMEEGVAASYNRLAEMLQ